MESTQIQPFLSLFCKELSLHLESASARQKDINSSEFAELVSTATKEILDSYLDGSLDLQEYHNSKNNAYKEIAIQSIGSFAKSNKIIEDISDEQTDLLGCDTLKEYIDFSLISEKMCDLQSHLNNEVGRANQIIQELNNQVHELEITTTLDPLTKAYNRHALQKNFTELLSKDRFSHEMFILMIDIDNFKSINDKYGHIAGDKVLIFASKLLKKTLRDGDKLYRFGGEEFVILLNRTNLEGATLVATRLLNLTRQNKPLYQNEQIGVTLSIGLTPVRDDDTLDTLIHRSDVALYRAKKSGKDRLEMEI
ncbi:MAG: GGDEF domain-containing protein [Epsilonproteobacteria bacterium]|nr:GGDEF domain-containing protein [Campylobacterota bacterium]